MKAITAILGAIVTIILVCARIIDAVSIPVFIVFLALKLCGIIAWSWVAVCAPIIALGVALFITIAFIIYGATKE